MVSKFVWNIEKNEWLKKNRGISFEDIEFSIEKGALIDVIRNHNEKKYPGQLILVVAINNYVYYVPFIENKTEIFLKTIIPNRKATKKYLNRGGK